MHALIRCSTSREWGLTARLGIAPCPYATFAQDQTCQATQLMSSSNSSARSVISISLHKNLWTFLGQFHVVDSRIAWVIIWTLHSVDTSEKGNRIKVKAIVFYIALMSLSTVMRVWESPLDLDSSSLVFFKWFLLLLRPITLTTPLLDSLLE